MGRSYSAVQWALNTAYRARFHSTPYHIMMGRAPRTALSTLASSVGSPWRVDVLNEGSLRNKVAQLVVTQEQLHKQVLIDVRATRARQRQGVGAGTLPNFVLGDYVLVARVRRPDLTPKLLAT